MSTYKLLLSSGRYYDMIQMDVHIFVCGPNDDRDTSRWKAFVEAGKTTAQSFG